jgi:hypothetical protein
LLDLEIGRDRSRFDLKYGMGGLSHDALMKNIELYATQVIPRVRELLSVTSAVR